VLYWQVERRSVSRSIEIDDHRVNFLHFSNRNRKSAFLTVSQVSQVSQSLKTFHHKGFDTKSLTHCSKSPGESGESVESILAWLTHLTHQAKIGW
jgi:hypothetical protein